MNWTRARRWLPLTALLAVMAVMAVMALAWAVPAWAARDEAPAYERARQEYFRLSSQAAARAQHSNWLRAAERFSSIYAANPHGDLASQCLWWMGRIHTEAFEQFRKNSDWQEAADIFKRLSNHHPQSPLADDAQFMLGQLHEKKGDLNHAYLEYLKVTVNYAKGDQVAPAKARLDALEAQIKRGKGQVPQRTEPAPAPVNGAGLALLSEVRHWSTPSYTRVVLSLERPVPYAAKVMVTESEPDKPRLLYLDMKGARVGPAAAKPVVIGDGLLRSAKAEQISPEAVRLVLDIQQLGSYKVFTIDNPFRVVVDCFASPAPPHISAQPSPVSPPAASPAPASPPTAISRAKEPAQALAPPSLKGGKKLPRGQAQQQPDQVGLAAQLGLRVKRVVLDPGHGGKDPGASFRGLLEKDLTLDLAKRAAPKVAKLLGAEVLLTRNKDVFVPLEDRTAFANTHEADVFVSIHLNAAPSSSLSGVETYFLNLATDENSMRVAARENATTQRSISDLQTILNDLMLNSKINESNRLARTLHRDLLSCLRKQHKVADLHVKQAPFYVLIGARMPAVLTEVGFITNPQEHQRLSTPAYREQLAEGLAQGIASYARNLKSSR